MSRSHGQSIPDGEALYDFAPGAAATWTALLGLAAAERGRPVAFDELTGPA